MLKIEVKDATVQHRSGNKHGRDWEIRTQEAYAYTYNRNGTLSPFPEKIQIQLENPTPNIPAQPPYAVGTYYLHPACFYVGDYSTLRVGNIKLLTEAEYRALTTNLKAA